MSEAIPTVIIISSCLVKVPSNYRPTKTRTTTSRLDLTPWDLQFLQLDPIQKGLLFRNTNPQDYQHESPIDHLRSSLSKTLEFFPPLAGRLSTSKTAKNYVSYSIECNNAGVEFVHASAKNVSVSDILEPNYTPRVTVYSFFALNGSYRNSDGDVRPLLGVQVTELSDGIFIAVTANHVAMDGFSFWHFFNSWAEISRGCSSLKVLPSFDRWFPENMPEKKAIPLPRLERKRVVLEHNANSPPRLLEKVFRFDKESLTKLKAKANSAEDAGIENNISSLQSLSAHLWRSVERCRRSCRINASKNIKNEHINDFMILISARQRIPLPDGYFGNTVYPAKTSITYHELLHGDFRNIALKINELVREQTREATMKYVEDWVNHPLLLESSNVKFVMSSSPRFDVYGCDFGWGKPLTVRSGKGQKKDGKMTLFPSTKGDGIDVEVCLEEETLKSLESDSEFVEAL